MDKSHVIVALDVPWTHQGWFYATLLLPHCTSFKIGMELFLNAGMSFVSQLSQNDQVFLDLKLADTPDTVRRSVKQICRHRFKPRFLSVRGTPAVVRAAIEGRGDNEYPKILLVPMLSSEDSWDDHPYSRIGKLVREAEAVGCEGYVASGKRIAIVRDAAPDKIIVSPGIRLPDQGRDNHRHSCTPSEAARLGSTYIVVGRHVIEAENPVEAFNIIVEDLENVE